MVNDIDEIQEYPFRGAFYDKFIDTSKPLDEQIDEEILVLETECDIQEQQELDSGGFMSSTMVVYFPFDKDTSLTIRRGMTFKGSMYGIDIVGMINNPVPSQLGGVKVVVKDLET